MIIQRYLAREVIQSFAGVTAVLLLIYVSNRAVRFLAEAAAGTLSGNLILQLLALKLIGNFVLLIPLALYVAILLALGRLYRDGEIVAMTAGGVGPTKIAGIIFELAVGFGVIVLVLSLVVAPKVATMSASLTEKARSSAEVTGIYPGRFKEFSDGDQIFYVERVSSDRQKMGNVFVQVRTQSGLDVLFAKNARQLVDAETGDRFMVLEEGYRYGGSPGDPDYVITRFKKYAVRIDSADDSVPGERLEAVPTLRLIRDSNLAYVGELQWRISLPISTVLLALLAVPMARTSHGEGRYVRLFSGVLVYFVYTNLLNVAQRSIESGDLSPLIGVWPVHAALALLVLGLMLRPSGGGWPASFRRRRPRPHP